MGMNIVYTGLESLIYEDLCKIVTAPLDLVMSQDSDEDDSSAYDRGVFQGRKEGDHLYDTYLITYITTAKLIFFNCKRSSSG